MKRILVALISTALVPGALNSVTVRAGAHANPASPPAQARAARIRFAPRFIRGASRRLRYTIKAKYPQAIGADPRVVKLNQAIKDLVTAQVNDFKKDFQAPEERMGPTGSSFDIGYSVELATNDLVSILFYIDSYYEGAAHPNHNTLAFNYDLNAGRVLKLADLFKPNSNYLSLVSNYSVKALKKELGPDPDTDWIEKGAGASDENYRSWNITRKGLQVTFDPYQVASYAEGEHVVVIPYSVLKNGIDPAGPLAKIAR